MNILVMRYHLKLATLASFSLATPLYAGFGDRQLQQPTTPIYYTQEKLTFDNLQPDEQQTLLQVVKEIQDIERKKKEREEEIKLKQEAREKKRDVYFKTIQQLLKTAYDYEIDKKLLIEALGNNEPPVVCCFPSFCYSGNIYSLYSYKLKSALAQRKINDLSNEELNALPNAIADKMVQSKKADVPIALDALIRSIEIRKHARSKNDPFEHCYLVSCFWTWCILPRNLMCCLWETSCPVNE